jgi:uncharacterized membrane protein
MASTAVTTAPAAARGLTRVSSWTLIVWLATAVYAVGLTAESISRQNHFRTGFDAAIEDQFLWLAAHGHHLFSTIVDRSLVADHFQPGLLLLTPLYWLGLGVSGMLAAQSIALALVAPALYALARDRGASPRLAALPALLWLASPWTATVNLFDFHPEAFVPVLLVVGVLASFRERWLVLALTAAVAMSVKEDIPLAYFMFGVVLIWSGKRRAGAILAAASAAAFVVAHEVEVHTGNAYVFFGQRFAGDRGHTVGQALVWMLEHPGRTVLDITSQSGVVVFALFLATAGLALLAPRWLLLAVPTLAHNLLSAYPFQHSLEYQYHLLAATGLFVAAAVGVPKVARFDRTRRLAVAVAVGAAALVALSAGISVHVTRSPIQYRDTARVEKALSVIPPGASVAASVHLEPHLSHRVELYTLPEPFVPIDWGGSSTRAELAEKTRSVRYVALVSGDGPLEYKHRVETVLPLVRREGFREIYRDGSIIVLERSRS